jgi:hypothetical protein
MARKFLVVLGLVAALTLGSLAVAPKRQVAQAATTDSLVLVWNEEALESVRKLPPRPDRDRPSAGGGAHRGL